MAEDKKISPTVDEPKTGNEKDSKPGALKPEDLQSLLGELESLRVTKPEDLRNMAKTSQEAGNLARMLGELRKENQELKQMLQGIKAPKQEEYTNPWPDVSTSQGAAIDLEKVVEKSVWKVVNKIGEMQRQTQERVMSEYNMVRSNPRYKLVSSEFEAKLNDPAIQQKVYSGEVSLPNLFAETVIEKLESYATKSADALKQFARPGSIPPPVMETGENVKPSPPRGPEELRQRMDQIRKNWKGQDADVDAALDALLPKDDPIFRVR